MMYIYKTTNLINQKIYIGQHHAERFDSNYLGSGLLIRKALLKYGKENFKTEMLEECFSQEELDESEKKWINFFDSTNKVIGYNIAIGGQCGGILCTDFNQRISGENYYLNKYSKERRELHLNKYRRGENYWTSRGFKTEEDKRKWIEEHECGKNHFHKKFRSSDEYQKFLDDKYRGNNFWLYRCLSEEDRNAYIENNYVGKNNPIRRNKTDEEYEEWLNQHRRGKNAGNAKYVYTIVTNEGKVYKTECLRELCREQNFNEHVLLKLIDVSEGKRASYIPRIKKYLGWTAMKEKRQF